MSQVELPEITGLAASPQTSREEALNRESPSDPQKSLPDRTEPNQELSTSALAEKATVVEKPFVSEAWLVGPLIVRVRGLWNWMSTKWYVRPLIAQQNEFNWAVIAWLQRVLHRFREIDTRFREIDTRFWEIDTRVLDADHDITHVTRNVAQIGYRLNRLEGMLEEHLGTLQTRLDRIETLLIEPATADSRDGAQD